MKWKFEWMLTSLLFWYEVALDPWKYHCSLLCLNQSAVASNIDWGQSLWMIHMWIWLGDWLIFMNEMKWAQNFLEGSKISNILIRCYKTSGDRVWNWFPIFSYHPAVTSTTYNLPSSKSISRQHQKRDVTWHKISL